ncbi:MAG: TetR/AcrR family transcriptional regulator [Solirubrobacterales bacterium]
MANSLERRHNRRRRHERTRQELISAALDQAVAGSFKDLTVEGVTRAAGVSRSAFYVYFGDKEELLLAALEDLITDHRGRLGSCWAEADDPRRALEKGLYSVARAYDENSDLLGLAFETATYDEEVREIWMTLLETVAETTAERIRALQLEGVIPAELDPEALAEGLVLMTERSFQVNLADGDLGADAAAAAVTKVWWAALFTTSGVARPGAESTSGAESGTGGSVPDSVEPTD